MHDKGSPKGGHTQAHQFISPKAGQGQVRLGAVHAREFSEADCPQT